MSTPLVSIITPSFNSEKFITETIESVMSQTYSNWELLITDDGSTDSTVEIVKNYHKKDNRVKLFIQPTNKGAGAARNNSIKNATGRFIAFLDSDDRWLPYKLEIQVKFMKDNSCALSYSSYELIDQFGDQASIVSVKPMLSYATLLKNNYIGCLTAMYDCKMIGKMYMPEMRKRQDWALWLDITKTNGAAKGIQKPLAVYRIGNQSISQSKLGLFKYNYAIYRDHQQFGVIKSCLMLLRFMWFYFLKKISAQKLAIIVI